MELLNAPTIEALFVLGVASRTKLPISAEYPLFLLCPPRNGGPGGSGGMEGSLNHPLTHKTHTHGLPSLLRRHSYTRDASGPSQAGNEVGFQVTELRCMQKIAAYSDVEQTSGA